jgi:hypothetical protein
MLQDEKDILLHAIDNTEDVLLHRAWSEEAKQRVREARRAGRKVSEMFANLYSSSGRFINNASRTTKRYANAVDSKLNISEHNGKTRQMLKKASQYPYKAELSGSGALRTLILSRRAKRRQYGSLESRLKRMSPINGRREMKRQLKDANKFTNKNYKVIDKRIDGRDKANAARERIQEYRITGHGTNTVTRSKVVKTPKVSKRTQAKLNASRDHIQEQRITGKAPTSAKRTQAKLNASRDRIQEQRITGKTSSATKRKKTTKRSGSGLTKSAQAKLNASRDHIQEQRNTGKAPTSAKRTQARLNTSRDHIQEQRITGKTSNTYKKPKVSKRTQAQLNDMRERMQRRRLAGNYDPTTDSYITRKGNSTTYEDASGKGSVTISPRKRKKTTKRSKRSGSGLSKSARARLNASRDRIQQYRITGR